MLATNWHDSLSLDDDSPASGPVTDGEIAAYLAALNALSVTSNAAKGYRPDMARRYRVESGGRKFLRVIAVDQGGTGRSAFLFIEIATGNLYKPASWKGPIRNFVRGNIRDLRACAVGCDRYV